MKKLLPVLGVFLLTAFLLGCVGGGQQPEQSQTVQNATQAQQAAPDNFSTDQEALNSLDQVLNQLEEQGLANASGELA